MIQPKQFENDAIETEIREKRLGELIEQLSDEDKKTLVKNYSKNSALAESLLTNPIDYETPEDTEYMLDEICTMEAHQISEEKYYEESQQNKKEFTIIAAVDLAMGIGKNNTLPWECKSDMQYFKNVTTGTGSIHNKPNVIIMGHNTYLSLPKDKEGNIKPLPDRINAVITTTLEKDNLEIQPFPTFDRALEILFDRPDVGDIFVIGGGQIYRQAINHQNCSKLIITKMINTHDCDVFFPEIDLNMYEPDSEITYDKDYYRVTYNRIREKTHDELQFINVLKQIMTKGRWKMDRTQIGTLSLFGQVHMSFDLRNYKIPVLTSKFIPVKTVIAELFLFLSGKTNVKEFHDKKFIIWDGNTSREYLDSIGLADYNEFETGPFYGWQWRNFGKPYVPEKFKEKMNFNNNPVEVEAQGFDLGGFGGGFNKKQVSSEIINKIKLNNPIQISEYLNLIKEFIPEHLQLSQKQFDEVNTFYCDQVQEVIHLIKTNPSSRRIMLSAWNPNQIKEMCLPPCHVIYQWEVCNSELSCTMFMRSNDMGLGAGFNIASASLLTHILAEICGIRAIRYSHYVGDAHIYANHFAGILGQVQINEFYDFPTIKFNRNISGMNIDEVTENDVGIVNYKHHKKIQLKMAV
jgi:dihydrofolate reductase/thymidylate synthase